MRVADNSKVSRSEVICRFANSKRIESWDAKTSNMFHQSKTSVIRCFLVKHSLEDWRRFEPAIGWRIRGRQHSAILFPCLPFASSAAYATIKCLDALSMGSNNKFVFFTVAMYFSLGFRSLDSGTRGRLCPKGPPFQPSFLPSFLPQMVTPFL